MNEPIRISDERIAAIEADKKHWANIIYGAPISPEARRLINILKRQHHELLMALKAERKAFTEAPMRRAERMIRE